MRVLVTGGAGYIGSHAALRLLDDGHEVSVIDDLSRGHLGAVRIFEESGGDRFCFAQASLADREAVERLLRDRRIDTILHFAGIAYVGESVDHPLRYYARNTAATISLLESMAACGVARIIFSSTCATYGEPDPSRIPIAETCPQAPVNPYGRSKYFVEQLLLDHRRAELAAGRSFSMALLRYFNVAGSDVRGRLGEDHRPETHLIPICLEVAAGQRPQIGVFGTDYPTPDGTCLRDYVHVDDLVDAHVAVLGVLRSDAAPAWNIGLGRGISVREVIDACRRVTGHPIPVAEQPRRPGDPPALFADPSRIRADIGWSARCTDLDEIVRSAWQWRCAHPHGYLDCA